MCLQDMSWLYTTGVERCLWVGHKTGLWGFGTFELVAVSTSSPPPPPPPQGYIDFSFIFTLIHIYLFLLTTSAHSWLSSLNGSVRLSIFVMFVPIIWILQLLDINGYSTMLGYNIFFTICHEILRLLKPILLKCVELNALIVHEMLFAARVTSSSVVCRA